MDPLESDICTKHGQQEESSYSILYQWPAMGRHKIEIFSSVWLEPIDITRASIRTVMFTAL
jgi:hypothetical protein